MPRPGRTLLPRKTGYPLYRSLGGPQGWSGRVQKISPPPGFDPWTVQPVASHYTDWAMPAHTHTHIYYIDYWTQQGCLTWKLPNTDCNILFACTLEFLTFSIHTQNLFTWCYLRNTYASTFLFTCATWCVWHGLVTRIKRTLHSNCLISLLHNHRVLLNYYMVHIPSTALCRSNASWKDLKCAKTHFYRKF